MAKKLEDLWRRAAAELTVELMAPFLFRINNDITLHACFMVKNFGAKNGMLIFKNFLEIKPYLDDIKSHDYGFSIMDEPDEQEEFVIDNYISVLNDWGWTGKDENKPCWLGIPSV